MTSCDSAASLGCTIAFPRLFQELLSCLYLLLLSATISCIWKCRTDHRACSRDFDACMCRLHGMALTWASWRRVFRRPFELCGSTSPCISLRVYIITVSKLVWVLSFWATCNSDMVMQMCFASCIYLSTRTRLNSTLSNRAASLPIVTHTIQDCYDLRSDRVIILRPLRISTLVSMT